MSSGTKFQFTPLREGRHDDGTHVLRSYLFQFTPLREGRRGQSLNCTPSVLFQFTPLREGRLANALTSLQVTEFQFTPLREGRRQHSSEARPCARISIHAPPRGATSRTRWLSAGTSYFNSRPSARGDRDVLHRDAWRCLFQFTPLREGRPRCAGTAARPTIFQFTPLREGRRRVAGHRKVSNQISIHAPPRGATIDSTASIEALAFQFTPLREGRRTAPAATGRSSVFQFTPLREGRQGEKLLDARYVRFQFTPLREGRRAEKPQTHRLPISIHAPPRGATYGCGQGGCFRCISIHAPPRGATRPPSRRTAQSDYFNSRPSARGDARKG